MNTDQRLAGRRVLLVEDQVIIAMELEAALKKAGCEVVGPVGRLKPALELARRELLHFAVLDVNLCGEKVFPVAHLLESRGIPFVLATGYGESAVPEGHIGWRVVSKPYDSEQIVKLIFATLRA